MPSLSTGVGIQNLVILGMFIVGVIVAYRISKSSKLPADTIKNLQESNASLVGLNATREAEIKKLSEEVHANNTAHTEEVLKLNKEISELVGQVKVYKELPLQELANGIKQIADLTKINAESNQKILDTLVESAHTLSSEKHDGGLLVKTKDGTPLEVNVQ